MTVITGYTQVATVEVKGHEGDTDIYLSSVDGLGDYISLNGTESHHIQDGGKKSKLGNSNLGKKSPGNPSNMHEVRLSTPLKGTIDEGSPVFAISAITYRIRRVGEKYVLYKDSSLENDEVAVADNITKLEFRYRMKDGSEKKGSDLNKIDQDPKTRTVVSIYGWLS